MVDHDVRPGVESDMGGGDEWPSIRAKVLGAEILLIATPTWLGEPSSVMQRVMERMDAMLGETDDEGRPVAYNRFAGVVVTGNEDGAHHVIAKTGGSLIDIGFTVPGQSWTYWNMGRAPAPRGEPLHPRRKPELERGSQGVWTVSGLTTSSRGD
ncbi:MAG: NAD(P)H-dependent oxidoreductase [Actinomycetota bacterium]|nr:NAD(P)H-dependent oxidoreductase [Actinomycetota bacterium]